MPVSVRPNSSKPARILVSVIGGCIFAFLSWMLTDWLMGASSHVSSSKLVLIFGGPCFLYPYTHGSIGFWLAGVLLAYWPIGYAIVRNRLGWRAIAWAIGLWFGQGFVLNGSLLLL